MKKNKMVQIVCNEVNINMIKYGNSKRRPKARHNREPYKKITTIVPKGYFYEITDQDNKLVVVGVDGKEIYPAASLTVRVLKNIVSQPSYKIQMKNVSRIQAAELRDTIKKIRMG